MSALFGISVAEGKIDPSSTLKELGIDDLTLCWPKMLIRSKTYRFG